MFSHRLDVPTKNVPLHSGSVSSLSSNLSASLFSLLSNTFSSQAAEKVALMRTLRVGERCLGLMGSCNSSTEKLPFKQTHLLTNTNNGLHGCQFSVLHSLTPLPPFIPLSEIKGFLFKHSGSQGTGDTE
ncbi:hypothetical protein GOODEAATRI_000013 [Goodea atripinnis]|uniref:Uncharacterized protein n=1 Tax=Goodea atripinnis TaxID=208336 RepID=A0ABV0P050_9TELE